MGRDHSILDRCKDCGAVVRMLVHERGIGDDGERYQVLYADQVPHSRRDCAAMQALAKEEWPRLW